MTVIGLDDTDSRKEGMCTTYVGHSVSEELQEEGYTVERVLLIRLNPAVKHKTRGNAAIAIHTSAPVEEAHRITREHVENSAKVEDERTHPGIVVYDGEPDNVEKEISQFTQRAIREIIPLEDALQLIETQDLYSSSMGKGRGRIGAIAAIGAWSSLDDWTYEYISYREPEKWGTPREVNEKSVFEAADNHYPNAWDTVDKIEEDPVCVPHAPGPILYGIRGDTIQSVKSLSSEINSETVHAKQLFHTNQGTDVHLQTVDHISEVSENSAYKVTGTVTQKPTTKKGGHVFFEISDGEDSLNCAAFEPTKHFRDDVRNLRVGDKITVCGEVSQGTLKLEKFAVRELVKTEKTIPTCPSCARKMESAGRNQGYRCKDCSNTAPKKGTRVVSRELEKGWYEVPPCARRHIAKPLIRGDFDDAIHPHR